MGKMVQNMLEVRHRKEQSELDQLNLGLVLGQNADICLWILFEQRTMTMREPMRVSNCSADDAGDGTVGYVAMLVLSCAASKSRIEYTDVSSAAQV